MAWLTPKELAARIGYTPKTVYAWARAGIYVHKRMGPSRLLFAVDADGHPIPKSSGVPAGQH